MKPTTLNETDEKKQGSDHDEPETKQNKNKKCIGKTVATYT